MRFINSLNNCPDSIMMEGVISEITIEKTEPHLIRSLTHPVLYKIVHLPTIHKLNVVDVSVLLTADCHCFGLTVGTESLGVRRMAVTSCVNFKSKIDWWQAVGTLRRRKMLAVCFFHLQVLIKRQVGRFDSLFDTVQTLSINSMSTLSLHFFLILFILAQTIDAFSIFSMITLISFSLSTIFGLLFEERGGLLKKGNWFEFRRFIHTFFACCVGFVFARWKYLWVILHRTSHFTNLFHWFHFFYCTLRTFSLCIMNANIYLLFWEGLIRNKLPSSSERIYLVLRGAINAHKIGGMSAFL